MTPLVPVMMWGWIPVVLALFLLLPARRAAIAAFLFAWMFLPVVAFPIKYMPDYTKITATCYGVLLGMLLLDTSGAIFKLKFSPFDVPVIIYGLVSLPTSIFNGLGVYDGVAASLSQAVLWGVPYLVGRAYLASGKGAKEMAVGLVIAGIVYLPFVLYEMKFAPILHRTFYGFMAHADFAQAVRMGGWRPMVFMNHGLMLSIFMISTALVAIWLWYTGAVKRIYSVPMAAIAFVLTVVAVLCRSTGATGLLLIGLMTLGACRLMKTTLPMLVLIALPFFYVGVRVMTPWQGEVVVPTLTSLVGEGRAKSLQYRIDNEVILTEHAMKSPFFGWGGWDRSRTIDGRRAATQDSLWIIALGVNGMVGLTSLMLILLAPPAVIFWKLRRHLLSPEWAPVTALATISVLYMIDGLVNAMVNPIFTLAAGSCAGLATHLLQWSGGRSTAVRQTAPGGLSSGRGYAQPLRRSA